jgi:hypothetical protein
MQLARTQPSKQRSALALISLLGALVLVTSCTEPTSTEGLGPEPADLSDTLAISPQNPQIQVGQQVVFTAPDRTVNGSSVDGEVAWTATGGTIDSNGVFMSAVSGTYTVSAERGNKKGRSKVTVTTGGPSVNRVSISPATLELQPGAQFKFAASGSLADGTTVPVAVAWTATGGTIDTSGNYRAGSASGTYRVVATQQGGTLADTSAVSISASAPTLQSIDLTPATVSVAPGGSQQFAASGRMSDGSTSSVGVTWSATGGTISSSGLFAAGQTAGTYRVIATSGTLADTSVVTVAAPPPSVTLAAVVLSPASVTLAASATQQFSAVGRMSDGSTSSVSVTWGGTGGSVSASGLYTAGSTAGTYRVIATSGTLADTSTVTITPPPPTLTGVVISPATVSLAGGASQQFSAAGQMSDGSTSSVAIAWNATGGTVSSTGWYTAGQTAGTFRVIATSGSFSDTAAVTVSVRTLTSLTLSPNTVTLATGATQQFAAAATWSDGTTTLPTITWSATGGTISTSGSYTAGSTAGTYRVIAAGGGRADTSSVTITAPAPVLTAVEVAPGTASVGAGGTQPFTATGRLSDGSTASVAVTWTATGGTIGSGGLYTAGATAGTYRVIAQQQGGSLADTAAVTVTVAAPPPTSGGTVDPTLLPAATGQAAASAAAYTALPYYSASGTQLGTNPRTMPVGAYYLDPTTGVKVVRLTSPTAPFAASGAWMSGVDYAEGGLRIGRPAGSRYLIPVVPMGSGGGQGFRLLSFDLSSYAVGVSMATAPGGTNEIARAMSYTSPGVMYTINGGILRKWDVSGASAVEIVSGPFPKDLRAYLHGQSSFTWFQGSTDDRWFAMMAGYSGPWLVGFDAQTNTVTEKSVSGIDEPKMDRDGRYVWARGSTPYVWDMQANTLAQVGGSQPAYDGHGGVTRGYAFGNPNDGRPGWSINLRSTSPTYQYLGNAFNLDNMYLQGGWADQAAGGTTSQWVSVAYQTGGSGEPGPVKYRYGALGLYRLDGSEHRLLAHAYNSGNVNGTQAYYANAIWPNFSPDGRFLIFKSNQLVTDGFSSLFAAILPSR